MKMNRIEMAKKLQGLQDLREQARTIRDGTTDTYVERGLMTAAEYKEYCELEPVLMGLYKAMDKAEKAVEFQMIGRDRYPKRYLEVSDQLEAMKPTVELVKDVDDILRGLFSSNHWGSGGSEAQDFGIGTLADQLFEAFRSLDYPEGDLYACLEASKDRLTREGTIARRLNYAGVQIWDAARQAARDKASETYHAAHQEELNRYAALQTLVDVRREQKIREIGKQVKAILEEGLAAANTPAEVK